MKVCIACSAGGHLTEALQLKEAWKGISHYFVTDRRENAIGLSKGERVLFVEVPRRNPLKLLKNAFQSLRVFLAERPDVVVSTGADVAIPTCLIAKAFGSKIVFIESFCRISEPSFSGRIMYYFADLFLVQWKENLKFFPNAKYYGSVF